MNDPGRNRLPASPDVENLPSSARSRPRGNEPFAARNDRITNPRDGPIGDAGSRRNLPHAPCGVRIPAAPPTASAETREILLNGHETPAWRKKTRKAAVSGKRQTRAAGRRWQPARQERAPATVSRLRLEVKAQESARRTGHCTSNFPTPCWKIRKCWANLILKSKKCPALHRDSPLPAWPVGENHLRSMFENPSAAPFGSRRRGGRPLRSASGSRRYALSDPRIPPDPQAGMGTEPACRGCP